MPVTIYQQCVHTLKDIKHPIWTDEFPYITYEHLYTSMLCVALDDIYIISDDLLLCVLLLWLSGKCLVNVCMSQAMSALWTAFHTTIIYNSLSTSYH